MYLQTSLLGHVCIRRRVTDYNYCEKRKKQLPAARNLRRRRRLAGRSLDWPDWRGRAQQGLGSVLSRSFGVVVLPVKYMNSTAVGPVEVTWGSERKIDAGGSSSRLSGNQDIATQQSTWGVRTILE